MPGSKNTIIKNGTQLGSITVIKLVGLDIHKSRLYACRCCCGNEFTRTSCALHRRTKKCPKCALITRAQTQEHRYGAGFAAAIAAYKNSPHAKEHGWEMTEDWFFEITQKPCHYCGIEPLQVSKKSGSGGKPYTYNGIDRIDSNAGYTAENTVPCCRQCNFAKRKMTVPEFFSLISKIYELHCSSTGH